METILKYICLCLLGQTRDIVGRFFTMLNANIGLCSQVRPNFYNGVNFALHMHRGNCRSGSISKNHQLTNLNKCGMFHACIRNSTILALSLLAIFKLPQISLNAPITTKVFCVSRLLKCLRSLYGKHCGSRSESLL